MHLRKTGLYSRETEVSDLDCQVVVKEDVVRLEVSVNDVLGAVNERQEILVITIMYKV